MFISILSHPLQKCCKKCQVTMKTQKNDGKILLLFFMALPVGVKG